MATYYYSTDATWSGWTSTTSTCTYSSTWVEQRDAEYGAEQDRQAKIRAEKEKAKEEKARQLLKEVLTEEQDAQLTKDGYFELTSVKSGKRYRIKKGFSMNVEELDKDGKRLRSMCFHPNVLVHHYDNMAIQKLMLENDEEEARKVANFS